MKYYRPRLKKGKLNEIYFYIHFSKKKIQISFIDYSHTFRIIYTA